MRSIETNASSKVLPEQRVIVAATSMDEGEGEDESRRGLSISISISTQPIVLYSTVLYLRSG
jgi:hypothetical protein